MLLPEELALVPVAALVGALCWSTGTGFSVRSLLAGYAPLFLRNLAVVLAAGAVVRAIRARRGAAMAGPGLADAATLVRAVAFLFAYVLLYTNLKVRIPLVHPGNPGDAVFAGIDGALGGGGPAAWVERLKDVPWLVRLLSRVYRHNYALLTLTCLLLFVAKGPRQVRHLFVAMGITYLLGVGLTLALPSLGPCFVDRSSALWLRDEPGRAIWRAQELLLRQEALVSSAYWTGRPFEAVAWSGIAAFPSLHVAHCVMLCWLAHTHHPRLLWLYVPVTALVVLATIVFGWHWAADALGALPLVAVARWLAGRLVLGHWNELGRRGALGLVVVPVALLGLGAAAAEAPMPRRTTAAPRMLDDAVTGEMVAIPAGAYGVGCNAAADRACGFGEGRLRTIRLPAFSIDRTEVSVAAWHACVAARVCTGPSTLSTWRNPGPLPVAGVSWEEARAFCAWAGKRLPSEVEWEAAARGTDGRVYPWGVDAPTCARAHYAGCGGGPRSVGGRPAGASPFGVLDLAGNVWEWVEDVDTRSPRPRRPFGGPPPGAPTVRVFKGGGFGSFPADLRASRRAAVAPIYRDRNIGLRCARDAVDEERGRVLE